MPGRARGVLVLGWVAVVALGATAATFEKSAKFPLAAGSRLRVEMGVGELRIVPGREPIIRVHVTAETSSGNLSDAERELEIRFRAGGQNRLEIHAPSAGRTVFNRIRLTTEITVPENTHLDADLGVGQMRVQGIEGDLKAHVGVGELRLEISETSLYKSVRAEAGVGDLHHPFRGRGSGWLGKSYSATFSGGRYTLEANVGVGEIRISEEKII